MTDKRIKLSKENRIFWSDIQIEDGNPLNGEEIVNEIRKQTGVKTTRQNISNALKSSMISFYNKTSQLDREWTPFQIASVMLEMLYQPNSHDSNNSRGGVESFYRLFPKELKNIIKKDALNYCPSVNK